MCWSWGGGGVRGRSFAIYFPYGQIQSGLSHNWWGSQAWDTLQDSTDNSSIDKAETSLDARSISLSSKIQLMHSLVTSISLYAFESWTLTGQLQRRIQAMEMRCYRKILPSHAKTMLPMRKSVPRSSRQLDHTERDTNCSGIVMSPVHQVCPKPSCTAQWKGEEDKAHRGRGGKTASGNGQAWSSAGPRGQWRTGKNGENWLRNHLGCPNDPRG